MALIIRSRHWLHNRNWGIWLYFCAAIAADMGGVDPMPMVRVDELWFALLRFER